MKDLRIELHIVMWDPKMELEERDKREDFFTAINLFHDKYEWPEEDRK